MRSHVTVASEEEVNMKELVESDQEDVFLQEEVHEEEVYVYKDLSELQSDYLTLLGLIQVINLLVV